MSLIKYKVLESDCKDDEAYIPEKATPIGINYSFLGKPSVVFVMKYTDWLEEFPDEAKKEEEEGKAREQQKGVGNA